MQKKSVNASERYKKRIKRRRIFLLAVFVVVVLICVCLFTPIFNITEITVTGNTVLSSEEIISTSGIEKGENVFRISKKRAKKKLNKLAYVEGIEIKRKFPAKVVIEVDEAAQDIIIDTENEFIIMTIDGRVLEKTDDVSMITSPILYGVEIEEAEPTMKIKAKDTEAFNMNLERISCFYGTEHWAEINEFYVSDISNFIVVMKSGMKVTFGAIDNIEQLGRKIKIMGRIFPQITQTENSYLDLTDDKGYFGEYTKAELEEMRLRREKGEGLLVKEEEENNENASDNEISESKEEEKPDEEESAEPKPEEEVNPRKKASAIAREKEASSVETNENQEN